MDNTGINSIVSEFIHSFIHFAGILEHAAMNLAVGLAVITLALTALMTLVQGDDLSKMVSKLLQTGLLFGLFFGLIHLGGTWIPEWLNSFMAIGAKASGLQGLSPNSVFLVGANIAGKMFSMIWKVGFTHIPTALLCMFTGFFLLIIYCFICAELTVNLVKTYALVAVGPIIFALGNSDFTRSAVTNYLQKIIGMGLHLMILYVLVGVGVSLSNKWILLFQKAQGAEDFVIQTIVPVIGGLIVLYLVIKNVPAFIATISGAAGFRNYGDAAIAASMTGASLMAQTMAKATGIGGIGVRGAYHGLPAAYYGAKAAGGAGYSGSMDKMGKFWNTAKGDGASLDQRTGHKFKQALAGLVAAGSGAAGAAGGMSALAAKHGLNTVHDYVRNGSNKPGAS